MQSILNSLTLEQFVDVCMKIPTKEELSNVLKECSLYHKEHIFPLLDKKTQKFVSKNWSTSDKEKVNTQVSAFLKHNATLNANPNTVESLFFLLAKCNAKVHECHPKISYIVPAKELIRFDLKAYKYQRKLSQQHVENIAKGINESKMFYHPIICAFIQDKDNEDVVIIDGQHRWNALQYISEDIRDKMVVPLDIYCFPTKQDLDTKVMEIYRQINTILPIHPDIIAKEMEYVHFVEECKTQFPNAILSFKKNKHTVGGEYIIDTQLKEESQLRDVLELFGIQECIRRFHTINQYMKKKYMHSDQLTQIQRRILEKTDCYLGLNWPEMFTLLK